jgi:hypothetical protein
LTGIAGRRTLTVVDFGRQLEGVSERFENWILRGAPWTSDRQLRQIRVIALLITVMAAVGAVVDLIMGRWMGGGLMMLVACVSACLPGWYAKRR